MNTNMTALTKYSKVGDFVIRVASVYVVNVQVLGRLLADKAFVWIFRKGSFSIHPRAEPVILVVSVSSLVRVKNLLLALVATKLRRFASGFFCDVGLSALLASFFNYLPMCVKVFFPAVPATIMNCSRSVFRDVARSSVKDRFAKLTCKCSALVARFFVTISGAEFCSIVFKQLFARWTGFHNRSLTFAIANVNQEVGNAKI